MRTARKCAVLFHFLKIHTFTTNENDSYLSEYRHEYCEGSGEPNGHPLEFNVRILKKRVSPQKKLLFQNLNDSKKRE